MNVTEHFNDEPIDYFKISSEDLLDHAPGGFNGEDARINYESELSRITKDLIEPNEDGKIYDSLRRKLDLQTKNTSVINIGVGQGKTYTILKIVEEYFKDDADAYIIIAVPYVSLVDQYVKELIENGIPEGDIYRYEWLNPRFGELSRLTEHLKRRVHVVTANCLLGNAGEDAVINSQIKRNYLEKFPAALTNKVYQYDGVVITEQDINYRLDRYSDLLPLNEGEDLSAIYNELFDPSKVSSEISSKKVILIFDELHDAIHNFTDTNILNLYHWKDILQKIFLLSATFDDASLVIINQLSHLTEDKIQILESSRVAIREKQSELYIYFDNNSKYTSENSTIETIVKKAIEESKEIDILVYSKKLAQDLFKGKVGDLLREYAPENVKLCASELIANQRATIDDPKNRYDGTKINIGTNFKTGINISKENHCFIIVLPSKSAKMVFKNMYGIFSNGHLDIIQALARQRKKGEIHVVTMFHENMDFESLPEEWTSEQKRVFITESKKAEDRTERVRNLSTAEIHQLDVEEVVKYQKLNEQSKLINEMYNLILQPNALHALSTSLDFIKNKEKFRTEKGKKILYKNRFFGVDISGNLAVNAFTNQFINCRLVETFGNTLFFDDEDFDRKFAELFDEEIIGSELNISNLYIKLANTLFSNRIIYNNDLQTKSSATKFKKKIIGFLLAKNRDSSLDLFGSEVTSQHVINHILINEEIYPQSEAIPLMKEVFNNLKNIILTNNGFKYLPTDNKEIFHGVNVELLYSKLVVEFPIFIELGLLKILENGTLDEKKTIIFNIFSKSLGKFNQSRMLAFHPQKVKKLITSSEIATRLFS